MNKKVTLDWKKYEDTARQAIAEGCVLIENKNKTLPLKKDARVSVFGRIQSHYYKSGTGSGGMVNVSKVYSIMEGLKQSNHVILNEDLEQLYLEWEKDHPFDEGMGWGSEPWSQEEMLLTDEIVRDARNQSDIAIVIIGRTAGEDRDATNEMGSYLLTDVEEIMLAKVREQFETMIILLNVGSIIDMSFIDRYHPEAVMYVWQGGMMGGLGTADVLTGTVCPSGKLTDTIAYDIEDYPSHNYFGDSKRNFYCEDIYVGYRYFETFAKDKVRYPFGYGLSYTSFSLETEDISFDRKEQRVLFSVMVTNTGNVAGKEVVAIYASAPQGELGRPARELIAFAKSSELIPGQSEIMLIHAPYRYFSAYDDSGATGHRSCYVLEPGTYRFFVGSSVREAKEVTSLKLTKLLVLAEGKEALAPIEPFQRIRPIQTDEDTYCISYENTPLATMDMEQRRLNHLPKEITQTTSTTYKLADVAASNCTMEEFIAQMTDEDLACIIRGEGMGSSLVTPGTASAFGGVSKRLREDLGIPAVCCDDGPSGMRLDCGIKAFSLPNGVMLGCTFNPELIEQLYTFTAYEMISHKVECLLGPGMNIHRHPLNGRNFEYFSEDPLITGFMAISVLKGLGKHGVTGTVKHFCGNNQEFNRRNLDSIISERALREIYLWPFRLAVYSGFANSVMTTYGSVNGLFTASNYDLTTSILRDQWGFNGIVMTDWWADMNERNQEKSGTNFAAMVRAQNDLYMVCPDGSRNASGDNTLESLEKGTLTRAELQRSATNICKFILNTEALKREQGTETKVEIINRPKDPNELDLENVEYKILDGDLTLDFSDIDCQANTNILIALDVQNTGKYELLLTGNSPLSELAQLPCTLFYTGFPILSFTFHGTNGEDDIIRKEFSFGQRFNVLRLFIGRNGLDIKSLKFHRIGEAEPWVDPSTLI